MIIIDKPKNWTSRDVVNLAAKVLKTQKIGHTGTLDPLATGVLVLCVGKATKLGELLSSDEKEYIAEITLGEETDTLDLEGEVIHRGDCFRTKEEIQKAIHDFPTKYLQEVPLYSAVKVHGRKLYEYAREKEEVTLPKKEVIIKYMECIDYKENQGKTTFKIKVQVSKGTYIRSLVRDLCHSMNTVGVMSDLRRTKQGNFTLEQAITIEELKQKKILIKKIEEVLSYQKVEVKETLANRIKNGQKLENRYHEPILFMYQGEALALYKTDKDQIKPWKMFV